MSMSGTHPIHVLQQIPSNYTGKDKKTRKSTSHRPTIPKIFTTLPLNNTTPESQLHVDPGLVDQSNSCLDTSALTDMRAPGARAPQVSRHPSRSPAPRGVLDIKREIFSRLALVSSSLASSSRPAEKTGVPLIRKAPARLGRRA
uniref:Uncharacterized protein n=1 Tax=Oryza brachyantha TaxID=4533 RepID=J3N3V9_ORYBR